MSSAVPPTPWYRQFWPWFIMAFPASAVFAGIATVIIATQNQDSLVADDYYKEGLAINQSIERDKVAATLGIQALLRFTGDNQQVLLELTYPEQTQPPAVLDLTLTHPTLAQLDQAFSLEYQGDNRYLARQISVPGGEWHVTLEPNDRKWRLTGRLDLAHGGQRLLSANH